MKVIILGAGLVGTNIAKRLVLEDNSIVVVDTNQEKLRLLESEIDIKTVCGNGALPPILEEAGADGADLIIAATTNDEVNMVACQVAFSIFKVPTKIARVRQAAFSDRKELFNDLNSPIDVIICPEREVVKAIKRKIIYPNISTVDFCLRKRMMACSFKVCKDSPLAGVALGDMVETLAKKSISAKAYAIRKSNTTSTNCDIVAEIGDTIFLAFPTYPESARKSAFAYLGLATKSTPKYAMVVSGDGIVGELLAIELNNSGMRVKLICQDAGVALNTASRIEGDTIVLAGSGTDKKLIENENIFGVDAFIACGKDDESNILASLIAKKYDLPEVITVVNKGEYRELINELNLDGMISSRLIAISSILKYSHRGNTTAVTSVGTSEWELIEVFIDAKSSACGKTMSSISKRLPKGHSIIAKLDSDWNLEFYNDEDVILQNSSIVIIAKSNFSQKIGSIF